MAITTNAITNSFKEDLLNDYTILQYLQEMCTN
jgi:hypothetical protein